MKFSTATTLLLPALVASQFEQRGLQDLVKVETDFNCLIDCTVSPSPGNCFQLTDDVEKQSGVVWSTEPLEIVNSFVVKAKLHFGTNEGPGNNGDFPNAPRDTGADGIAFVLQNQGPETVGAKGGGMGLSGISPSLAVEFDTYQNKLGSGDPVEDHLALIEDGHLVGGRLVEPIPLTFNLEDGTYHDVTITWTSETRTIDVSINGTTYLSHSMLDLTDILGGDFAYLGFTSSTGDSKNRHEVCVTSIQGTVFSSEMPSLSPSVSSFPSKSPSGAPSLSSAPSNVPSQALLGSISGNVKADSNNDGIGDENLPNIPIELFVDLESVVALTLTDIAGNYAFYDLPIALYSVMKTDARGETIDNTIMVALTTASGSALNSTGNDFVDKTGKTISGVALKDTDYNGVGDRPNVGVAVELINSGGIPVAVAVTDDNGGFKFEGVPPGMYTVVETSEVGLTDVLDSDGGNPNVIVVNVTSVDNTGLFFVDAPVSSAPVTSAPVSSAPVSSFAPVTVSPASSAPVTSVPVTSAPTCGRSERTKHAKSRAGGDEDDLDENERQGAGGGKRTGKSGGGGEKRGLRRLGKSGDGSNNDSGNSNESKATRKGKDKKGKKGKKGNKGNKGNKGECEDPDDTNDGDDIDTNDIDPEPTSDGTTDSDAEQSMTSSDSSSIDLRSGVDSLNQQQDSSTSSSLAAMVGLLVSMLATFVIV